MAPRQSPHQTGCFTCGEAPSETCNLHFDTDEVIVDVWLCDDCIEGFDQVDWSEVEVASFVD